MCSSVAGFSSPILQKRKVLDNEFTSPSKLHNEDYLKEQVKSENWGSIRNYLQNKPVHTVVPGSAEKDKAELRANREKLRLKSHQPNPSPIKENDVTIKVLNPKRFKVIRTKPDSGVTTKREFGVHDHEAGSTLYPASGTGFVTLPGLELADRLEEARQQKISESLTSFLRNNPSPVPRPSVVRQLSFIPRVLQLPKSAK